MTDKNENITKEFVTVTNESAEYEDVKDTLFSIFEQILDKNNGYINFTQDDWESFIFDIDSDNLLPKLKENKLFEPFTQLNVIKAEKEFFKNKENEIKSSEEFNEDQKEFEIAKLSSVEGIISKIILDKDALNFATEQYKVVLNVQDEQIQDATAMVDGVMGTFETEVAEKDDKITQLEKTKQNNEQAIKDQKNEIENLKFQIQENTKTINEQNQTINEQGQTISDQSNKIEGLEKNITRLTNKTVFYKRKADEFTEYKNTSDIEIAQLKSEKEQLVQVNGTYEKRIHELEAKLKEIREKVAETQKNQSMKQQLKQQQGFGQELDGKLCSSKGSEQSIVASVSE